MEVIRPFHLPVSLLVVGEDRDAVQVIQSCFSPPAYHCVDVDSGPAALEWMSRRSFDLIFCDLGLPETEALEILRHGLRVNSEAAYLFMGPPAHYDLGIEAMRIGACDFLPKPLQPTQLHHSVRRALERRKSLEEKRSFQILLEQTLQERTDHLQRALQQVEESQRCTLEALVVAIDAREPETHLHSLRVEAFTVFLAEKCGYSSALMKDLSQGALLHDIGKIVVPDAILLKPDRLTPEEFEIMQQHTTHGFQILSRIPHLQRAAMLALCHHERVDGEGYPLRLLGGAILLEARIFAVADAVDVITAGRAYCLPRTLGEARAELLRCAGTQFDPDVVDVFLTIPDEEWRAVQDQVTLRYQSFYQPLSNQPFLQPDSF